MSEVLCPSCGALQRADSAFCTGCGATSVASKAEARERHVQERQKRKRLKAGLVAWGALLLLNGAFAFGLGAFDPVEGEALATGIMLVPILLVALPDRGARRQLSALGPLRDWLLVPLAVLGIWLFMSLYFFVLGGLGAETFNCAEDYQAAGLSLWGLPMLLTAIMPPLMEETFFRGVLQGRLEAFMSAKEALIVQAALFSVLHMAYLNFVSHFVLGLIFGLLRTRTGSLWPGILVHAIWNGMVLFGDWTVPA